MKKITAILLAMLMIVSCVAMTGCGAKTLSFGMGVYAYHKTVSNADGETNGAGELVATAAAVLVDADGKIVKCVIDTADSTVNWTSAGEAVAKNEFKTKYELGTNYNMAAYGTDLNGDGVVKEWFEQIDVFCAAVEGKTIDEVKAMLADGYYGTEELTTAGCTMGVADYVKAVEKAVANAVASGATANDTLKLGVVTTAESANATEEAEGKQEVASTFVAAAVAADGKVNAMSTDVATVTYKFDATGATSTDASAAVTTKKEAGANYGMAAYGADLNGDGKVLEWNEQGAAFDAACVGKTASEIAALMVDGYGVESLQTAGCTIGIADMVSAAVKAATL